MYYAAIHAEIQSVGSLYMHRASVLLLNQKGFESGQACVNIHGVYAGV